MRSCRHHRTRFSLLRDIPCPPHQTLPWGTKSCLLVDVQKGRHRRCRARVPCPQSLGKWEGTNRTDWKKNPAQNEQDRKPQPQMRREGRSHLAAPARLPPRATPARDQGQEPCSSSRGPREGAGRQKRRPEPSSAVGAAWDPELLATPPGAGTPASAPRASRVPRAQTPVPPTATDRCQVLGDEGQKLPGTLGRRRRGLRGRESGARRRADRCRRE